MGYNQVINVQRVKRATVTVPASGSTAQTPFAMASLASDDQDRCIGFKVLGLCSDGTSRAAITVGDATGSMLQYVAAGSDYYEPAVLDPSLSYFKAAAASTIANTVIVFYLI